MTKLEDPVGAGGRVSKNGYTYSYTKIVISPPREEKFCVGDTKFLLHKPWRGNFVCSNEGEILCGPT